MSERSFIGLKELTMKIRQQEDTIAQLVDILASTNQRVSELSKRFTEIQHYAISPRRISPEQDSSRSTYLRNNPND
ncbi:hypothetical protein DX933_08590 [Ornithinibacillus gellani]|uniref:hypothetical protein n=1 Tax=Ornithinibacillus gellani TaxID=2293253 RepID=UPI000F470589|nr:hypothetical protein [Ornithinibacillus gellani]TQS74821.1 hypothetical protein DX933_08590 [Ornithinibacillus gellani]